jgi:hypothetical protein
MPGAVIRYLTFKPVSLVFGQLFPAFARCGLRRCREIHRRLSAARRTRTALFR